MAFRCWAFFLPGFGCRLLISIFPFPLNIAECIGQNEKNRQNSGKLPKRCTNLSNKPKKMLFHNVLLLLPI